MQSNRAEHLQDPTVSSNTRMTDDPEQTFDQLVEEAVLSLPDEFAEKMENISVVVRDYPQPEVLRKLRIRGRLLGLYQGVPYGKKSVWSRRVEPDIIFIYKKPILSMCRTPAEVVDKVRDVVMHEIGHHFGLTDQDMAPEG